MRPASPGPPVTAGLLASALLVAGLSGCGAADRSGADRGGGEGLELTLAVERPVDPPRSAASERPATSPPAVRLGVGDVERSVAFYRDLLGFELVRYGGHSDGNHREGGEGNGDQGDEPAAGVGLVRGELHIELLPGRGTAAAAASAVPAPAAGQPVLLVEVSDVAGLFDLLGDRTELVRALTDGSNGRREFAVADPDGHLLVFSQRL